MSNFALDLSKTRYDSAMNTRTLGATLFLWAGTMAPVAGAGVQDLAWLHGCWEQASANSVVEEQWMAPRAGTLLGLSRTVRDGRLREYEFILIREQEGRLVYRAHPSGQAAAEFVASTAAGTAVVFENPQHDFPQRIGYERRGDDLLAWIEGVRNGQPRRIEFPYRRVSCEPRR